MVGLSQESLARAGIKVNSKVHLSAVTENTVLMKEIIIKNCRNCNIFTRTKMSSLDDKSNNALISMENVPLQLKDPLIHEYAGFWPKDPLVRATKLTSALAAQLQIAICYVQC